MMTAKHRLLAGLLSMVVFFTFVMPAYAAGTAADEPAFYGMGDLEYVYEALPKAPTQARGQGLL